MKILICLAALVVLAVAASPTKPVLPPTYSVDGTFSLPYAGLVEPFSVAYDLPHNQQYLSYFGGKTVYVYKFGMATTYYVTIESQKYVCQNIHGTGTLTSVFPDLTNYQYNGTAVVDGQNVQRWSWNDVESGRTNYYDFYVTDDAAQTPVQFHMLGYDIIFGSHYDEYVLDYANYSTSVNAAAFNEPSLCQAAEHVRVPTAEEETAAMLRGVRRFSFVPQRADHHKTHSLFAEFKSKFNKQYATEEEEQHRLTIFHSNLNFIAQHNTHVKDFKLGMNHFGDLTHKEFLAIHSRPAKKMNGGRDFDAPETHKITMDPAALPTSVDWRLKGAVTPVKDQGDCGSCWSFSTSGSTEGALFLSSGNLISLSEQHLVDCSWGWGNDGCDGGFQNYAFQYIIDNGGLATEESYGYEMINDFCRDKNSYEIAAVISKYVNVTSGNEAALTDALATVGPISVSIDASHMSMVWYQSGVYYEPKCKSDANDLDHAVLAVGYGTTSTGQDYYIVKNSWSTHWGNEGYIWMSRNRNNNCGIATGAMYPVI